MHFVLFLAISEVRVHQALLQLNKERLTTSSVSEFSHFSPPVQKHFALLSKNCPRQIASTYEGWPPMNSSPTIEKKVVSLRQIMSANSNSVFFSKYFVKLPNKFLLKPRLKVWIMTIMSPDRPCFVTFEWSDWTKCRGLLPTLFTFHSSVLSPLQTYTCICQM